MAEHLKDVPFVRSAAEWKDAFGKPTKDDIFDICVHHEILAGILSEFIAIGAKSFILPKPIALTRGELEHIRALERKHRLNIVIDSQWHYSSLLPEVSRFIKKHSSRIAKIEIAFSRSFDEKRLSTYTPLTAFVPHIVQILHSLGLIGRGTGAIIEASSGTHIRIKYAGKYHIQAESDIASAKKDESLKIYLKGEDEPALVTDFSGVLGKDGFVEYPSVTIQGKKVEAREDLLEKMIVRKLSHFSGVRARLSSLMSLERYLPVAEAIIDIADKASKLVCVIGGGTFGIMTALEAAKRGYSVVVFEKEQEILTGASLVNHCRVHMGYHYPRDEKTARESKDAKGAFEKAFGPRVIRKIENYYLIAKEGSKTSVDGFKAFCKKLRLPYKEEWPKNFQFKKEKIALSVKVPEPIFDVERKREFLYRKLAANPNVTLLKGVTVTGLERSGDSYTISYGSAAIKGLIRCAAVVNATYGGINYVNRHLGLPLEDFQYELCEIPVVDAPWDGSAWMIIDGPFFSVMPFGYSDKYLLYDVELAVLERVIGKFPEFKKDIAYYNDARRKAARFERYRARWKAWFPGISQAKHSHSMYITRAVLPKKEKTDERPTIVNQLLPGFWQIFSGKIVTSVPSTVELGDKIDGYLKERSAGQDRLPKKLHDSLLAKAKESRSYGRAVRP